MWIPDPIYERIPQFWLLLGLLFISLGLYIGFEFELIFFYLALGVLSIARGAGIQMMRLRYREKRQEPEAQPTDNDDTGITPVGS